MSLYTSFFPNKSIIIFEDYQLFSIIYSVVLLIFVILIVKWRIKVHQKIRIRIQTFAKCKYIQNIAIQSKSVMEIENQKKIVSMKKKGIKTKTMKKVERIKKIKIKNRGITTMRQCLSYQNIFGQKS